MKILISIAFNALILYAIAYFLPDGVTVSGGWKLYFIGGFILGILNFLVKPLLKIIGFPFMLVTFGAFTLVINGILLYLLQIIIQNLHYGEIMSFSINNFLSYAIAIAILSFLNTIYATFLK